MYKKSPRSGILLLRIYTNFKPEYSVKSYGRERQRQVRDCGRFPQGRNEGGQN